MLGPDEDVLHFETVCICRPSAILRFAWRALTKRRERFIAPRFYKYRFVHARINTLDAWVWRLSRAQGYLDFSNSTGVCLEFAAAHCEETVDNTLRRA